MSLTSALLGPTNPFSQWLGGNRNMLLGLSSGLLSGNLGNAPLYAMEGRKADDAYATQQKAETERQAQINQTVQFLQQNHPDLAQMVESGMDASAAFAEALKRSQPGYGQGGNESFFGNIVPMQDENGNVVLGQASNQGRWQPLQGADGFTPAPTTKTIDTGTEIITTDIYGNELYRVPKQNFDAAYDTAAGGAQGRVDVEIAQEVENLESRLPGLQNVVAELGKLADTATYTQAGRLWDDIMRETGQMPSEGAQARAKYIATVDNEVLPLLRETFGAAFTVEEGKWLRATMGNPDMHPKEKQAQLEAFIASKIRNLEATRRRVPSPGNNQPTTQSGGSIDDILGGYGL